MSTDTTEVVEQPAIQPTTEPIPEDQNWLLQCQKEEFDIFSHIGNPSVQGFIRNMGESTFQSGMLGCTNSAQGHLITFFCLVEKISQVEFAKNYHIVQGKISMRSDAMLARYHERGGEVVWLNFGDDGIEAKAKFKALKGSKKYEIVYSIEDAKRANLIKTGSGWTKDPGPMLRARLISKAMRILAPEIVAGAYTPEELEDIPAKKNGQVNQVNQVDDHSDDKTVIETTAEIVTESEVVPPPAKSKPVAKKTETKPEQKQEPVPFEVDTKETGGLISDELFSDIARLVNELQLTKTKVNEVKKKYGVTTLKNLTTVQAETLHKNMITMLNRNRKRDGLDEWVDGVTSKN